MHKIFPAVRVYITIIIHSCKMHFTSTHYKKINNDRLAKVGRDTDPRTHKILRHTLANIYPALIKYASHSHVPSLTALSCINIFHVFSRIIEEQCINYSLASRALAAVSRYFEKRGPRAYVYRSPGAAVFRFNRPILSREN